MTSRTATPSVDRSAELQGRKHTLAALQRLLVDRRAAGPLVILPILIVVFQLLNSHFLTTDNLLNILAQSSVPLILCIGATYVILMGSIDLSVGSVVTLTGVSGAELIVHYGPWALLLVPLLGLAVGAVNGFLFAYANLPSFLVTLGTMYAFNGIALYITNGSSVALNPRGTLFEMFGGNWGKFPAIAFWAFLLLAISIFVARRLRFGRYTYVLGGGETVARLSGVPVRRYKFYVFVVSGLLASLAGLLLMYRIQGADPDMGTSYLLPTIAAVVMGGTPLTGGVGGPHRSLLGVFIIIGLSNGMTLANVHPYLQIVVQGCVVILAVALAMDRRRVTLMK